MALCQIENLKISKISRFLIKCGLLVGCSCLGNLKLTDYFRFMLDQKHQKMKNCSELPSKLRHSLDLKKFKIPWLMWLQLQTKPKKLKPQNICTVVTGAKNQNLKTSKLLVFSEIKTTIPKKPDYFVRKLTTKRENCFISVTESEKRREDKIPGLP